MAAGEITVGTLATFLTFMTILQMPVRQLGLMVNAYARASTCGARLFGLIDMPVEVEDRPGAKELEITEGTLRLDNVGFAYDGADGRRAISGISFEAKKGETIGIVGPPGSGKTTLMHLIPRFYDVTEGGITIWVYDAKTNDNVWYGWTEGVIRPGKGDPEQTVRQAIDTLFEDQIPDAR